MRTRPFLSHKREERGAVVALKRTLAYYGVGGWRDLDDLHLGELNQSGFERAIDEVTGGCIWYGTRRVLGSWYVNNVELPTVVDRKRREPDYPLVPLFVTVSPHEVKKELLAVAADPDSELSRGDVELFMDANGQQRERGQRNQDYRDAVARRYVRSAVRWLGQDSYTAALTALTEPAGTQDFTFDWRPLIDPRTRVLQPGAEEIMRDALTTFRDAVKPTAAFPHLTLDLDLPLPMAALAGYEWRVTSRLALTIRQRTRSGVVVVDGDGPATAAFPGWDETDLPGSGPTVVAVSTTPHPLTGPLRGYAEQVRARRTLELHLPRQLDAEGVRGLGRHIAVTLRQVNNVGQQKHLLLAGPAALAMVVGAGANGSGPVTMPLWNGTSYQSTVVVGD
jgi:hypothetical protein